MAVVLLWSTTALVQGQQKRFTVMGLGDSITEGGSKFSSYLYPLWEQLYSAGYDFDFIGPRQSECRIGKLNHCGFSGKNVEFLAARMTVSTASILLILCCFMLGTTTFQRRTPSKE